MLPHRSQGVTERFNEYENDVNHKYVMCNGLTVTRQPRHQKHLEGSDVRKSVTVWAAELGET